MTFEEIQQALGQILAVQRELQNSQLRLQERQIEDRTAISELRASSQDLRIASEQQRASIEALRDVSRELIERSVNQKSNLDQQERIISQLVGYSITNESDHLDLQERMQTLERRLKRVEERNGGNE